MKMEWLVRVSDIEPEDMAMVATYLREARHEVRAVGVEGMQLGDALRKLYVLFPEVAN